MSIVYNKKNRRYKIKIYLLISLFLSIMIRNILFAQGKKEERDPFLSFSDRIRLSQESEDLRTLPYPIVLSGIIWTQNLALAVLNNEIVQEGQEWRDFVVEKINKDKVTLRRGNSHFDIPLVREEEGEEKR